MKHQKLGITIFLSLTLWASCLGIGGEAPNVSWGVQFGTTGTDFPKEVATDADGNVYVVGTTTGKIDSMNTGKGGGFLIKFNPVGNQEWARQIGTASSDAVTGVTVLPDQSVVITGSTKGTLGAQKFGNSDLFTARYDSQGNRIWIVQMGTSTSDIPNRIISDADANCYITGVTLGVMGQINYGLNDVFVCKLDSLGNQHWITQFGTTQSEQGTDLTMSSEGKIYVSGITSGGFDIANLGNTDAFVAKLDSSGVLVWVRQFGSNSQDEAKGVALGVLGHVYVGGWTGGVMQDRQFGGGDAFLTCFDQDGNRSWTRQFGTSNWDGAHGLAAFTDNSGDVLIGGCWNWPSCHGWMRRYSDQGDLVWEKLVYTDASKSTCGQTVFVDRTGDCYHIGGTDDAVYAASLGGQDAFLVKLSSVSGVHGNSGRTGLKHFQLFQNWPNPFNPETEIRYSLHREAKIRLSITDATGKSVATLVDENQSVGDHSIRWNGTDDFGRAASTGIYFCRLTTESGIETKKMVLIQ
jgi:hypothetical protein